mgnify:CR=1 FL=1
MTTQTPTQKIERRTWELEGTDVTISYYVDEQHQKNLERILPHEQITGEFPFDFSIRGALLPFIILCREKGYVGLDKGGYDTLGKLIIDQGNFDEAMWIGNVDLDSLVRVPSETPNLLLLKHVDGKKVYFPTGHFVEGNR